MGWTDNPWDPAIAKQIGNEMADTWRYMVTNPPVVMTATEARARMNTHAVFRAPCDGVYQIDGELKHLRRGDVMSHSGRCPIIRMGGPGSLEEKYESNREGAEPFDWSKL